MKKLLLLFILIFNFTFADATKDLYEAVKESDINKVKLALANNANPNAKDEKGNTPLDYMFDFDNKRDPNSLILHDELVLINTKYEIMKKLIEEEVNVNYTKMYKNKILFYLIDEINNVFIMNLREISSGNNEYNTEEKILLNTYLSFFKLLLENNVNPNVTVDIQNYNIKLIAYTTLVASELERKNDSDIVREVTKESINTLKQIIDLLIDTNVDYKAFADMILIFESKVNNWKIVEKLLKNGAKVNSLIQDEFPLYVAAKNNSIEVMKLLIENGAYIDGLNDQGETPLYIAVVNNALESTKLLIEKGADIDVIPEEGVETPLMIAINNDNDGKEHSKELIKLLVENGANIDYKISDKDLDYGLDSRFTPLCYANNIEVVKMLIEKGADVNNKTESGVTVLMNSNSLAKEKLLIENGANVNAIDNEKNTVLLSILTKNKENEEILEMSKLLIEKGVDIKLSNNEGNDLIMLASGAGLKELANILIEKGLDIKKKNKKGETPLMLASASNSKETVQFLIEKGAKVNSVNNDGYNSLMYAIETGVYEVVNLLLEKGADINSQTFDGVTPLKIAKLNGLSEIENLLLEKGAKEN